MLDFKNSIWRPIQSRTLSYDMSTVNLIVISSQWKHILHKNCIRITPKTTPSNLSYRWTLENLFYILWMISSAVDRGLESRSGQTKAYKIGICCFSTKHAALRRKEKNDWLRIRIMFLSGVTCLSADCCFSELALYKWNQVCWKSRLCHHLIENVTCSHHDIAEK
jgi:hypothetical protein